MLQGEHSAILSTFIKLPFVIKIFVLFIFEWLFNTGFTVSMQIKLKLISWFFIHANADINANRMLTKSISPPPLVWGHTEDLPLHTEAPLNYGSLYKNIPTVGTTWVCERLMASEFNFVRTSSYLCNPDNWNGTKNGNWFWMKKFWIFYNFGIYPKYFRRITED